MQFVQSVCLCDFPSDCMLVLLLISQFIMYLSVCLCVRLFFHVHLSLCPSLYSFIPSISMPIPLSLYPIYLYAHSFIPLSHLSLCPSLYQCVCPSARVCVRPLVCIRAFFCMSIRFMHACLFDFVRTFLCVSVQLSSPVVQESQCFS